MVHDFNKGSRQQQRILFIVVQFTVYQFRCQKLNAQHHANGSVIHRTAILAPQQLQKYVDT